MRDHVHRKSQIPLAVEGCIGTEHGLIMRIAVTWDRTRAHLRARRPTQTRQPRDTRHKGPSLPTRSTLAGPAGPNGLGEPRPPFGDRDGPFSSYPKSLPSPRSRGRSLAPHPKPEKKALRQNSSSRKAHTPPQQRIRFPTPAVPRLYFMTRMSIISTEASY